MTTWYPAADAQESAHALAATFLEEFERKPEGVWAAPGRVNLIGEHVDYAGGLCLPLALQHRTYVALALRTDGVVRLRSGQDARPWQGRLDEVSPGTTQGWASYAVGVAWALRQAGRPVPGFDAFIAGQVPLGAGLSSSAALESSVAVALDDLVGAEADQGGHQMDDAARARLAAACVRAENEIAGAPTGGMDQAAALRARAGHALLLDCRDFSVEHVPLDFGSHDLSLLVIDTRAHHALVDGQYGSRRSVCEAAAAALEVPMLGQIDPADLAGALDRLARVESIEAKARAEMARRVQHVVSEIERVRQVANLLRQAQVHEIGPVLDASHASLRDDYEVSCPELDVACAAARSAGALGARMTGGGFGGSAIALVRADAVAEVALAVNQAFAQRGFAAPAFLRAEPSSAATRVA